MKRIVLLLICLASSAWAADPVPSLNAEQQAHYQHMISQLRCLVCQNETIADSTAPLALDLREQVRRQIGEGRSDAEIRQYLTDRYGDFVLYKPPLKTRTIALWFGPFLILALTLVSAVIFTRRSRRRAAAAPVDQAALQRLLSEQDRR